MAGKIKSKSTPPKASSWWSERSKLATMRTEKKTAASRAKKKVKTKKAAKAETGETYYCEICGCEMVCAMDSSGEIVCCGEPMCIVL